MTLLDIVQDILNDIDSDEVNSIDDTVESAQVAQIVKSTYFAMMSNRNWPHLRKPLTISPTTDLDRPTHMSIDDDVKELCFVNYDKRETASSRSNWQRVEYREPEDYLKIVNTYNELDDNVDTVSDTSGMDLYIYNDRHPTIFTSFDDSTLVFNAYDSERESNLQQTYIQAIGYVMPDWEVDDDFTPDLPEGAFTALLEEAKSRASLKLRQVADQKAEQESQKQQRWLSRKARRIEGGLRYPDYGRHR